MAIVTSKIAPRSAEAPADPGQDPWAAFRELEILELNWAQKYRHSLGKYSHFFLELENKRFLATRCPVCGKVWAPPRPVCPDHLEITEWVELSGRGTLFSYSVLHYAPAMASHLQTPYVLAYVRMDGADTLFAHLLQGCGDLAELHHGMAVKVVYNDGPVDHPILLMAFEPA